MVRSGTDDLSVLAVIRDMDSFDFGTFELPVWRRSTPWKLWHYPFAAIVIRFCAVFAVHAPANMAEDLFHDEYGAFVSDLVMMIATAGLGLLLITLILLSPFMALTVRMDRHWVEAWYYGANLKRRHFKEPLANYTSVVLEMEVHHVPAGETLTHNIVYCVELEHPDPLKRLPLYQGNEKTAQARLKHAARVLDLPMIGSRRQAKPRLLRTALLDLMETTIADAARAGAPFTKRGRHGVFARHVQVPADLRALGRKRLQGLIKDLIKADRVGACAARNSRRRQWLDVPGGPYDRGEGEI